jgi:hypothetical protein
VFPQLKSHRPGPAEDGAPARPQTATRRPSPARPVRALGFAAVAVAAAVTVAGCKPGTLTSGSGAIQQPGTISSSWSPAQAISLAAQQFQQLNSVSANLQMQATGGLNASMVGNLNEVLGSNPMLSVNGNAGALGHVRFILDNGMAYMRSPLISRAYGKPWLAGPYASFSSGSGLNLGSLLALLQASSPMVQSQLFGYGSDLRMMGVSSYQGMRTWEYGGHYMLSSVMNRVGSDMQPTVQWWMNNGIQMTRFRVWMDHHHMMRKLVLILVANHTTITITLNINGFNTLTGMTTPPPAVVVVLPGTSTTPTMNPTMPATPTAMPTVTVRPTATAMPTSMATTPVTSTPTPGMSTVPTPVATPSGMPTHW